MEKKTLRIVTPHGKIVEGSSQTIRHGLTSAIHKARKNVLKHEEKPESALKILSRELDYLVEYYEIRKYNKNSEENRLAAFNVVPSPALYEKIQRCKSGANYVANDKQSLLTLLRGRVCGPADDCYVHENDILMKKEFIPKLQVFNAYLHTRYGIHLHRLVFDDNTKVLPALKMLPYRLNDRQ